MNDLTFTQRLAARIIVACFLIFIAVSYLLQHLINWFSPRSAGIHWRHRIDVPEFSVVQLSNPCVITRFARSSSSTTGYPLTLETSTKADTKCYILYDINVDELHRALLGHSTELIRFFRISSRKKLHLKLGKDSLRIEKFDHQFYPSGFQLKRNRYPIVIGFVSDCCEQPGEYIIACCYVIHLRFHAGETVDTGLMYTFWKTNWNRLLRPQAMYAARDNSAAAENFKDPGPTVISQKWTPSCFICLGDVEEDLRVLLPCHHAGLCINCYNELLERTNTPARNPIPGLVCPLCRTPITAVMKLTSGGGDDVSERSAPQHVQAPS